MASPMRAVAEVLSQLMHPNRAADIIRMADADPAFAAKLLEAVQADDFGKSLRMLVADTQWGAAPARPAPVRPEAPAALTTAQRMMANPDIQSQIQSNMGGLPPELAQRIQAGDPDAAVEAYQMIAAAEGELPPFRRIGESLGDDPAMLQQAHSAMRDGYPGPFDSSAEEIMDPAILGDFPPAQQELMRELAANEWLGFDYPSQAANAVLSFDAGNFEMSPGLMRARAALIGGQSPPPARQMELPLGGENELPPRGLIPFGVRGEGVPVGGPTWMGTARDVIGEMIPAPLRGIPGQTRGLSTDVLLQRLGAQSPGMPRLTGPVTELPLGPALATRAQGLDRIAPFPQASRMPAAPPPSGNMGRIAGAGAAGVGIGALVNQMMQGRNTDMSPELLGDLDDTSMPINMEDLPAAQPELAMEPPVDYSLEARKLIDQLNAMRRQAGGEVPEAAKMQPEIQRLLDLGNKTRRATYAAAPQDESSQMFQQAQGMIDQVNDLYRQGHSQGSPQVRQIMQEVSRLQQAGDAIRNRRSA